MEKKTSLHFTSVPQIRLPGQSFKLGFQPEKACAVLGQILRVCKAEFQSLDSGFHYALSSLGAFDVTTKYATFRIHVYKDGHQCVVELDARPMNDWDHFYRPYFPDLFLQLCFLKEADWKHLQVSRTDYESVGLTAPSGTPTIVARSDVARMNNQLFYDNLFEVKVHRQFADRHYEYTLDEIVPVEQSRMDK
jgi:hypothetical protein